MLSNIDRQQVFESLAQLCDMAAAINEKPAEFRKAVTQARKVLKETREAARLAEEATVANAAILEKNEKAMQLLREEEDRLELNKEQYASNLATFNAQQVAANQALEEEKKILNEARVQVDEMRKSVLTQSRVIATTLTNAEAREAAADEKYQEHQDAIERMRTAMEAATG